MTTAVRDLLRSKNTEGKQQTMQELMTMVKLDIERLRRGFDARGGRSSRGLREARDVPVDD